MRHPLVHSSDGGAYLVGELLDLGHRFVRSRLVELPGGDNYPHFDHVELTVSALEDFLIGTQRRAATDRVLGSVGGY